MIAEQNLRNLNNFLTSYTIQESTQLLNQAFDQVTEGINYANLNDSSKEQMLDFLESLEELLPAVYEIYKSEQNS